MAKNRLVLRMYIRGQKQLAMAKQMRKSKIMAFPMREAGAAAAWCLLFMLARVVIFIRISDMNKPRRVLRLARPFMNNKWRSNVAYKLGD